MIVDLLSFIDVRVGEFENRFISCFPGAARKILSHRAERQSMAQTCHLMHGLVREQSKVEEVVKERSLVY